MLYSHYLWSTICMLDFVTLPLFELISSKEFGIIDVLLTIPLRIFDVSDWFPTEASIPFTYCYLNTFKWEFFLPIFLRGGSLGGLAAVSGLDGPVLFYTLFDEELDGGLLYLLFLCMNSIL